MCGCLADNSIVKKADDILFNKDPSQRKRCTIVLASPGYQKQDAINKIISDAGCEEASFAKAFGGSNATGTSAGRSMEEQLTRESTKVSQAFKVIIFKSTEMKLVIGGFPRTLAQLDAWNSDLNGCATIKGVVFIELPEEVQLQKLKDQGYLTDEAKTVIDDFKTQCLPLIEKFEGEDLLIRLDGTKSQDDLFKEMMDQVFAKKLHL